MTSAPWIVACVVASAGCAGPLATRNVGAGHPVSVTPDARAGWAAAVNGKDDEAASRFRAAEERDPSDLFSLFGTGAVAFERGDSARALSAYLALAERVATGGADPGPASGVMTAMAAGRIAVLLEEFGGAEDERRVIEDRLLGLPLSRLTWEARHALAMLSDHAARRRGDAPLLARAAEAAGCVRTFTVAPPVGILPHLDLDAAGDPHGVASPHDRVVQAVGCVVAVPSFDGRAGAQRLFATVDVRSAGSHDVVLDFRGEARVIVDGGAPVRHGGAYQYGPRVSASRVVLSRGRHSLEIRLATFGGHPEIALLVAPVPGDANPGIAAAIPKTSLERDALPAGDPITVALDFATTYVANRNGDSRAAWQGAARLEHVPQFAVGLALTAAVAHDDPSRPANFTRDRARALLRAAVNIDPRLARSHHALAAIALDDERPREAIDEALAAAKAAPGWWLPEWTLYAAYRQRGLTWDADQVLDQAVAHGIGACPVVETALGRAEDHRDVEGEKHFGAALVACGRDSDERIERLRRLGDLTGAEATLRSAIQVAPDRDDLKLTLASVLSARGRAAEAAALLAATVERSDGDGQLRLADALIASGAGGRAKEAIAAALAAHPEMPEILRAARALGGALPLDAFRLDGAKVIRDFEASGRRYPAPAVVILDRTVTRVFSSGAEMVLNHEIVRVQSKEAIQKWGEINVPAGTEILVLRTHKADGSTREPEELAGKDTISAADLAVGDYVEKETIETRAPRDAFVTASGPGGAAGPPGDPSGGFLGDRFYFQSFDAPLDRSEYLLVTGRETADQMHFDRRAGAPAPERAPAPPPPRTADVVQAHPTGGPEVPTVVTTFTATNVSQLFGERSSVPSIEYVPSVRVSVGVQWAAWARFLREQIYGTWRGAPGLDRAATEIRASCPDEARPEARAAALVAWVGHNIDADDDLRDSASMGVARGRGNRLAIMLALARTLGLQAQPVLARSVLTADGQAPTPLEEADDFAEPLIRFELPGHHIVYADPRLKRAPLGYLPAGLDGARVLLLDGGQFEIAHSRVDEHRAVEIAFHLDDHGGGKAEVVETLRGWAALEWAEIVDRFGSDSTKLRQDFEQRWLGVHFPGAVLKDLQIEIGRQVSGIGMDEPSAPPPQTPAADRTIASSPAGPYAAAEVRLRYTFSSTRLALKQDRQLRFLPTFFRSQPGRRYATEPRRTTALLIGLDVPLDLRARIELPPGARLIPPPRASSSSSTSASGSKLGTLVSGKAGYRFWEDRRIDSVAHTREVLVIRRQSWLPIMRVQLPDYPAVAADLRRVDALEQEEVRIDIAPEPR